MRGMGIDATGTIVHDNETGRDIGMCQAHLEQWQRDYPEQFGPRLVIIGPLFADTSEWTCPVCQP
ncbi:hypothetical protein B5P44_00465 [Mycobacterium sp. CBMA 213]|uniref:Uncharacterized protein n=1 Tax=Mycolicibacterium sp. CBMA 213 TaxID=1968788 RepID=A0A343VR73_9MYCO|nr:hypothetical protein [Mycolicibacterium sp. CBMA 213]AVN58397.1 hypothetical protein B5P44_p00102 [Mycolicibacterium sp. CBMA 213]MUM03296.1 hypothetical protein [Mycolicibacterium sp. CBMA 213]